MRNFIYYPMFGAKFSLQHFFYTEDVLFQEGEGVGVLIRHQTNFWLATTVMIARNDSL